MRVVEAAIGGVITAAATVVIVNRLAIPTDRVTLAAVIFLLMFVVVLLRPGSRRGDR